MKSPAFQQGRPVLIGTTSVEISELLSKMSMKSQTQCAQRKLHKKEADIVLRQEILEVPSYQYGRTWKDIKLSDQVRLRRFSDYWNRTP